jgi:predicted nucleic acid-binding protein
VLDASAALTWFFEDERDDLSLAMAEAVSASGALIPALFRLEMQNALLQALRRKRMTRTLVVERLGDLDRLNLVVDSAATNLTFDSGFMLAERFGLSAYDAAYLELAERAKRPLMTRDKTLRDAARTMRLLWEPKT